MIKKILVTGEKGYIGTLLTDFLIKLNYEVEGVDIGYFENCTLGETNENYKSIRKDIRNLELEDLRTYDAVIHLAGMSNDPLGELEKDITYSVNRDATIKLADLCKKSGVKKFVYYSTQSIYGISKVSEELDEYSSAKDPITAYAVSKWDAEQHITSLGDDKFHVSVLRPATVFGSTLRLRSDIVFNNFMANAFTTGSIDIKSDGSPIRPIVHVQDMCLATKAVLNDFSHERNNHCYNVGKRGGNYTVKEIADSVQKKYPSANIFYSGEHGKDSRTYKVSFEKIHNDYQSIYQPICDLDYGAKEMHDFFNQTNFSKDDLFGIKTNRLNKLKYLMENGYLNKKFEWLKNESQEN